MSCESSVPSLNGCNGLGPVEPVGSDLRPHGQVAGGHPIEAGRDRVEVADKGHVVGVAGAVEADARAVFVAEPFEPHSRFPAIVDVVVEVLVDPVPNGRSSADRSLVLRPQPLMEDVLPIAGHREGDEPAITRAIRHDVRDGGLAARVADIVARDDAERGPPAAIAVVLALSPGRSDCPAARDRTCPSRSSGRAAAPSSRSATRSRVHPSA